MFSAAMFDFDAMKKKGTKIETLSLFHEDTIFGTDSQRAARSWRASAATRSSPTSSTARTRRHCRRRCAAQGSEGRRADALELHHRRHPFGEDHGRARLQAERIVAQDAGFSEKALYDAVGDKLEGVISRGSFSLDLAAKRPMVGKINAMYKEKSGKDFNDYSSRQFMGLIVMADAINCAVDRRRKDPRGAGRDRHAGRADHHAVEAREVRRDGPEQRRRSGAPAIYRRQVRYHFPAAGSRR
jgi:branched-chain amino acid transport system substrate-binding protein